jgi:hypothetical protein
MDLFAIWREQEERAKQAGSGIDPSMLMDD